MSDDVECNCGHDRMEHNVFGVCLVGRDCRTSAIPSPACDCGHFLATKEPTPAPESVYERARKAVIGTHRFITTFVPYHVKGAEEALVTGLEALDAGEKAEQRAEAAERERDEARARVENAENDAYDAARELEVMRNVIMKLVQGYSARIVELGGVLPEIPTDAIGTLEKQDPPKGET